MTSIQVPRIKEVIMADSDNQDINVSDELYLQNFKILRVSDSFDGEAINKLKVNATNKTSKHDINKNHNTEVRSTNNVIQHDCVYYEDHNDNTKVNDEQLGINEDAVNVNIENNDSTNFSFARQLDMFNNKSPLPMSSRSENNDDEFSTISSHVDISKELNIDNDEEKSKNLFKDDMEIDNTIYADNELDMGKEENKEILSPLEDYKFDQVVADAQSYIYTICERCLNEQRMYGELSQNQYCRRCKKDLTFLCKNCEQRFKYYVAILRHLRKECLARSDSNIKQFICYECNISFKCNVTLQTHVCRKNRCRMCDYTHSNKDAIEKHFLNFHIKATWNNPKIFSKFISEADSKLVCLPNITNSSNISTETNLETEEEFQAESIRLNKSTEFHCTSLDSIAFEKFYAQRQSYEGMQYS
ncbi:uncharacterized protein LOC131665607 [Phymastichus coffea]|uniref:uncharacterized protein LOC131665607 n=1 Tax=Phymastichus coffea TaxID=108790 RepID=UPI00273B85C9|nr:uncharacterized protein LOC131665607 [Phymastichus coffea]